MSQRIVVIEGDITKQKVDAIVNSANESLIAGGGVSGAIHRAAGALLEEECIKLNGCNEGKAKITKGYNLPAKWVIHTVGPVWEGGGYGEEEMLARCYQNSLTLANAYQIKTIAFPSISAGVYGFPIAKVARIALSEVKSFLEQNTLIEKVILVCYDKQAYDCYIFALEQM